MQEAMEEKGSDPEVARRYSLTNGALHIVDGSKSGRERDRKGWNLKTENKPEIQRKDYTQEIRQTRRTSGGEGFDVGEPGLRRRRKTLLGEGPR